MNKETHNSYFNFKKIIYLYLIKNDHYYPLNTNVKILHKKCSFLTFSLEGKRSDSKL